MPRCSSDCRTVQILATIAVSAVPFFSPRYVAFIKGNQWMLWLSLFGSLGFMLLTYWKRKSYPTNLVFLGGFTALEAYTISVIVTSFHDRGQDLIIIQALIITLGIFLGLTLFATQTKYDFTSWMPYLCMSQSSCIRLDYY